MKRWITIISCLLCLACALALCACDCGTTKGPSNKQPTGMNEQLQKLSDDLSAAGANRATAKVTYVVAGAEEDDEDSELKISIVVYDDSLGEDDTLQLPYFTPVTSNGGNVEMGSTRTDEIKVAGSVGASLTAVSFEKFSFDMGNFKDGEYSYENHKFQATVTDVEAFFGVSLEMPPAEAVVIITMRSTGQPKDMKITYNTESGNQVVIQMTYSFS